MRILSVVTRHYYGQPHALEPMFLEFTQPLLRMGHVVEHFDHVQTCGQVGPDECGARLVDTIRRRGYDLVFYQTGGRDFVNRSAIADAARLAPIVAWNSDDDWQWESYTRLIAPLFTYAITTYPHIYNAARRDYPNLLLSQWGCLDTYAEFDREKDLDFTFVGQVYRNRVDELRALRKQVDLRIFGLGALRVSFPPMNNRFVRQSILKLLPAVNRALAFPEVHAIWNRSKISYTPLGASKDPRMLQIKGRVFQMGLSGTLMLCQASDNLQPYYTAGKEYVPFHDSQDCVSKARYYLKHESERAWIAGAYAARTRGEHLWTHRFGEIFRKVGIGRGTGVSPVLAA
jgi:glycosyl transferase family 1